MLILTSQGFSNKRGFVIGGGSLNFHRPIRVMKTTLIYNPQAGIGAHPTPESILAALRDAGYDPVYYPTSTEDELDSVLDKAEDLVVVAGGDGSIRAVAIRLLGRDIKIMPLPMGTANNISRTLALTGNPLEMIAGLSNPVERKLDIGRMQIPEGPAYFLEAMGVGIFADILERYRPEIGKSIPRSIQTFLETVKDYQPKFIHINLDGEDLSGSYLLLEVMNTPTVGLRFMLAPNAVPDDGLFDLVLIHADQREKYLQYMTGVLMGNLDSFPNVSIQRGRHLEIAWRGFPLHLDAKVVDGMDWTKENFESQEIDSAHLLDVAGPFIEIELEKQAISFLLPGDSLEKAVA